MTDPSDIPADFTSFTIDEVERHDDCVVIHYGGRIFGGVMCDVLPAGVAEAIRPGAEIIVRYHTADTGNPGQIAHMLLRTSDGWAELYADWE